MSKCNGSNRKIMSRLLGSVCFAVVGGLADYAAADLNVMGSTHGQSYQGVAQPATVNPPPGAAASIPLSLCDAGAPLPSRYQNAANLADPVDPTVIWPANTSIVWVCRRGGAPFTFRYTGGFSARAYNAMRQPFGSPGSRMGTIVPGGTGCTAVAGNPQTDPGTGRQYNSFVGCNQLETVFANFGTSDTRGTAFEPNMCDQTGDCASPVADSGIQSFPIVAVPFVMIVGNGVQKCNPNGTAGGKITLTRSQVESIYSGQITSWNQLGYCVFSAPDTNGDGFPDLNPIGTGSTAGIDQSIVTCSRPVNAGTRIVFNSTQMINASELTFGTIGGGSPYRTFAVPGETNYLAPTVSDGLTCVQGRTTPAPASPANRGAITYQRADEAANSANFGAGNVGRMNGGYPVELDGYLPHTYVPPANAITPTDAERAAAQKDFRCGRVSFWADWVGIQRTSPVDANQQLWNQYVAGIAQLLPRTTNGYFFARNLRQPGQPVNSEMFVTKNATKGPIQWNPGNPTACR
ncbi:MAG: substrate-binding domain-containing protein [Nitrospira sp.]|nr:substrate-binding domain-containing protein [Nitrospira sp.]